MSLVYLTHGTRHLHIACEVLYMVRCINIITAGGSIVIIIIIIVMIIITRRVTLQTFRVVNIAIQVSLSLVSAIHLEYRRKYCQYFLQQVSLTVSPILFQPKLRY